MDYLCYKMENAIELIDDKEIRDLMKDLAEVMHDLEWATSGDYGMGTYQETLSKFKEKWFSGNRNERLKDYIKESLNNLEQEIDKLL